MMYNARGRDEIATPSLIVLMSLPVGYSWRVALQQSPLPLHQPVATLQQWRGELQEGDRCNLDPTLTCGLTLGAHPTRPRNAFTCAVVTLPQVPPYADGCHTCSIPSRTSASGWCLLIQYWPLFI